MNKENEDRIREALRKAIPPAADTQLRRDLWPEMLRRLDERPVQVPWFDWALAALLGVVLFFFPRAIPALLYYL